VVAAVDRATAAWAWFPDHVDLISACPPVREMKRGWSHAAVHAVVKVGLIVLNLVLVAQTEEDFLWFFSSPSANTTEPPACM
jgi:hypothetical protein